MGVWEFFASIIGSTAWPAAVVVVVFILRQPIVAMLGRARSVSASWGSVQIAAEMIDKLSEENRQLQPDADPHQPPAPQRQLASAKNRRLVRENPAAAVASAFDDVSQAAKKAVETLAPHSTDFLSFEDRVGVLAEYGFPSLTVNAGRFLSINRHDPIYSSGDPEAYVDAERYVALAEQFATSVELLLKHPDRANQS